MLCVKCGNVFKINDFINFSTGNINKTCCTCLQKRQEEIPVVLVSDFADIHFDIQKGKNIYIITEVQDLDSVDLKEIFDDLNIEFLESSGIKFRTTKTATDHLYSKCIYSQDMQKRELTQRKRNKFGNEKFKCCGILNIHRNITTISLMVQHLEDHRSYLSTSVDIEILNFVKAKAHICTPSQIYKQMLSEMHQEEKIKNVTLAQIR